MAHDSMQYQGANKAYALDATTPATVATVLTGGTFTFTESSGITKHPAHNKPMVFDLANKKFNEDFDGFLDSYIIPQSTETTMITLEDGTEVELTPSVASSKYFVWLYYGNMVGTKYPVVAGLAMLSGDTGNVSTGSKQVSDVPLQVTTVKSGATYVIPATVVAALSPDTSITGVTITIAEGVYGVREWTA